MHVVAAQAEFVSDALSNLGQEIIVGGGMCLLVIMMFLNDWRSSVAIGIMIPLSVIVALTLLQGLGVTINILSLGGLALGVGLLVDNAIVVAEATGRLRETGMPLFDAARQAAEEVAGPLTAGTLTTILVFGPIVFVEGLGAALFRDLSLSVVLAVGASLVLALTLLPVMMVGLHRKAPAPKPVEHGEKTGFSRMAERLADGYEAGMEWCIHRPWQVFITGVGLTVLTVYLLNILPKEILPQVDEGMAVAVLTLPEGTAIEETTRQAARIEDAAKALGSVGIYSRIGRATDEEILAGADQGSAAVAQLILPAPEGMAAAAFAQRLRAAVPDLAAGGLAIDLAGQSEFGSLIGREGRLVRVEVSSARADDAGHWADSARALLGTVVDADRRAQRLRHDPADRRDRAGPRSDRPAGAVGGRRGQRTGRRPGRGGRVGTAGDRPAHPDHGAICR